MKKPASLAVELTCVAFATPDFASFVILTAQWSLKRLERETEFWRIAPRTQWDFFLKAGLFGRLVFRVLRHHFLVATARWGLTPGWNVTESHLSRDFLMPSTDSEQFWCCYVENASYWSRTSLPSAKGGSDERSGSFLTCPGVERHRYELTGVASPSPPLRAPLRESQLRNEGEKEGSFLTPYAIFSHYIFSYICILHMQTLGRYTLIVIVGNYLANKHCTLPIFR